MSGRALRRSAVPLGLGFRNSSVALAAVAVIVGAGVGSGLVVAAVYSYPFPGYHSESVTVPSDATPAEPYVVEFDGATFTMSWPNLPPGIHAYSGEFGVDFNITEPSGVNVSTDTNCAACVMTLQTWYSVDGSVGIGWYNYEFGTPSLLVRD